MNCFHEYLEQCAPLDVRAWGIHCSLIPRLFLVEERAW